MPLISLGANFRLLNGDDDGDDDDDDCGVDDGDDGRGLAGPNHIRQQRPEEVIMMHWWIATASSSVEYKFVHAWLEKRGRTLACFRSSIHS